MYHAFDRLDKVCLGARSFICTNLGHPSFGIFVLTFESAYFATKRNMRSRKVFQIYSALSETEREAFSQFLISPYFDFPPRLAHFQSLLEEEFVLQPQVNYSADEIWNRLPDTRTAFRANAFDKLCSELLAALNEFLAIQAFRAQPAKLASHQVIAYVERHLDEWVPNLFAALEEKHHKEFAHNSDGIYANLTMLESYGKYIFRQPRSPKGDFLLDIDARLNEFFIAKKLELASLVDIYNRSFSADLELPYMNLIAEVVDGPKNHFPLLVNVRAMARMLTQTRLDNYYFQLKDVLMQQHQDLAWDEQRPLFYLLWNHCATRINAGFSDFESEMDSLQLVMLDLGLFLSDGKMPPESFKNIVQLRLLMGETEWVADFISTWAANLTNDHGGSARIYNEAVLAFYSGNYSACMLKMEIVLRDFKEEVFYGTDARIYILMSLYEKGKSEDVQFELASRINAFRTYLMREKRLGEARKQRYSNLIKQFRRLVSLGTELPEKRKKKAAKYIQTLDALRPVSNRRWFLKQVEAFLV